MRLYSFLFVLGYFHLLNAKKCRENIFYYIFEYLLFPSLNGLFICVIEENPGLYFMH